MTDCNRLKPLTQLQIDLSSGIFALVFNFKAIS